MVIKFTMQENAVPLKAFHSNHTFHANPTLLILSRLVPKNCAFSRKSRTKGGEAFDSLSGISGCHKILVSVFLALV